jgi:glycosyltransferase involved in cell wall biosynthesis
MNAHLESAVSSISVVVPTYYRTTELSKLLNSILEQTRKPMEIIIVDDTPNPSIKLTCEHYEKAFQEIGVHLFYFKNPEERSISIARNLGARMAKGDIVQFVDSDVILTPNYLQEIHKTFEKHSEALGVSGRIVLNYPTLTGVRENLFQAVPRLFFLGHYARNSCKHFEVPVGLTKEIRCEWFDGADMAFRRGVFSEFQFDENLVKYSWMECWLFAGQIDKAYPNRLILTPEAKCYHEASSEGRMEESEIKRHILRCRKYILTKLFGWRGLLMFGWQNLGILVLKLVSRIRRKESAGSEEYGL